MHLGNGTVTPACAIYGAGLAAMGLAVGYVAARRAGRPDATRLALASALVFASQAFNVRVLPGASGHVIGGFALAYLFGAGWGLLAMSAILLVQSVLCADGGWLSLGLNVLNMGVIPCLIVYPVWRKLFGKSRGAARYGSLGALAWASTMIAAAACSIELLSLPEARAQAGRLLGVMLGTHARIGVVEAFATVLVIALVARVRLPAGWARTLAAPASVAAVAIAAAFGASPFPDGLEYSLQRLGIDAVTTSLVTRVEHMQSAMAPFTDYAAVPTLVGCAAVAALVLAGSRILTGKRGHDAVAC